MEGLTYTFMAAIVAVESWPWLTIVLIVGAMFVTFVAIALGVGASKIRGL